MSESTQTLSCSTCSQPAVLVARKRCLECYLQYKREKVATAAATGVPVAKKGGADPSSVLFSPVWSAEKAWWLGATFGDGYCRFNDTHKSVTFVSGDLDLVTNWKSLTGSTNPLHQRSEGCWDFSVADAALAGMVAAFGMNGRKEDGLVWPESLPLEFVPDFVRGLWDTDGHVGITNLNKTNKNPRIRCSFTNKSEHLVDGILKHFPTLYKGAQTVQSGDYAGYTYMQALGSGKDAMSFLTQIYNEDTPVHLMCARKHKISTDYVDWYASVQGYCSICGDPTINRAKCSHCAKNKSIGAICIDCKRTDRKVTCKGRCDACYHLSRKGRGPRPAATNAGALALPQAAFPLSETSKTLLTSTTSALWGKLDPIQQDAVKNELTAYYINNIPPAADMVPVTRWEGVLDDVRCASLTVEGDTLKNASNIGQKHCLTALPHRYDAKHGTSVSVREAFGVPVLVRRAVSIQLNSGDPVHTRGITRAMGLVVKGPTNFAPVVARFLVDSYCPEGGTVLDPCAGFGGRLLGTAASWKKAKYIGIDPEARTADGNNNLAARTGCQDRAHVEVGSVEHTPFPKADIVLTCPPYYNCENYGVDAEKLLEKYDSYEDWEVGFMETLLRKGMDAAPLQLVCVGPCWQRKPKELIPLPEYTQEAADRIGLITERVLTWIQPGRKEGSHETIFVFRRPDTQPPVVDRHSVFVRAVMRDGKSVEEAEKLWSLANPNALKPV